jgi:osmoprotectant transport system permease protein
MSTSRLTAGVLLLLALLVFRAPASAEKTIVGSKRFTESYVLGEIAVRAMKNKGVQATHRQGLGGTIIVWQALKSGAITTYPEYTGTISEEILKSKTPLSLDEIRARLKPLGIGATGELGFNNTYALAMKRTRAEALGVQTISDLKNHPALKVGVTHEFLGREDGWNGLVARYGLKMQNVRGIDHGLGYAALDAGQIDLKDVYSTDAKIVENDLVVLRDDLDYFPQYKAVFLYRLNINPKALAALQTLEGTLDETRMTKLNARAEKTKNYAAAALLYFQPQAGSTPAASAPVASNSLWPKLWQWTLRHLFLVGVSLFLSILIGIPLGIAAGRGGVLGNFLLSAVGVIQTIPSLALLALLVPIPGFGISANTAIFALFLYGLLPIVRNTATGLQEISPALRESAAALGLEPGAQLRKIFLPMASRTILAGIKTSAVINVGTATIAALIGAGGLGEPIISGLNLNDNATILTGAIPAALLAIVVQLAFDLLDRAVVSKGLRLKN